MPELPEVETIKRELGRVLPGRIFLAIEVRWVKTVASLRPADFAKKIRGQKILDVGRRAKLLIFTLEHQEYLVIHLKMTGQLIYAPPPSGRGSGGEATIIGGHPQENPFRYTRLIFTFRDSSQLFFNDLRKFGWIRLLDQAELDRLLASHGLEPLETEFTLTAFEQILARYPKREIKPLLLDQKLIAGVGNIYADETCFAARILPTRTVKSLTRTEIKNLRQQLIRILKLSIQKKGTSSNNYRRADGRKGSFLKYLKVYGRAGEPCQRCHHELIEKIKVGGRGTHFCPRCQI